MSFHVHTSILFAASLALAAGPATAQSREELVLRPGDALRVAIKNEPAMSGDFPVAADGTVMLPIIGIAQATDKSVAMLRSELESRYARELADPEVQLTPLVRVSVLGEVHSPGLFLVDPTHVVRDVIALAGGLTPSANRSRVRITRGGTETVAEYEAGALVLEGGVRSGDEIFVDRRSWLGENLGIFIGAAASVAAAAVTSWIVR
jgi:polysaccharide export outer membrane protein